MAATYIGAPAPTKFSPALDQSTVKHLRMTVKHVSKASPSVVHLYVQCGMVGFPVAIHAPSIPDIFVGDELVGEYLRGANPLDAQFTAIYSARMQPAQKKESPMTDIIVAGARPKPSISPKRRHDMPVEDYLLMIICLVAVSGLIVFVWERHLSPPLIKKYDGQGAWAKNSETPPWGWPLSIALGISAFGLLLFGPTVAVRIIGM